MTILRAVWAKTIQALKTGAGPPTNLGHFFMAIDIGTFLAPDSFKDLVGRMLDELKSAPPMEGSAGIFMPGEMEYLKERDYLKSGIPVSPKVLKTLDTFAEKIGIAPIPR